MMTRMTWPARLAGALAAAMVGAGCSTATYDEAAETGESMRAVANHVAAGQEQLDSTMAALDTLLEADDGALADEFESYRSSLDRLESTASEIQSRAARMRLRASEYLEDWEADLAEIRNEDIRTSSEERRQEVRDRLESVIAEYEELADASRPLVSDLRDIETALQADLTRAGVDSIRDAAQEAMGRAEEVLASSDTVIEEFRELGLRLTPTSTARGDDAEG